MRKIDASVKLASAQHALARSYGVTSWPRLVLACRLIDAAGRLAVLNLTSPGLPVQSQAPMLPAGTSPSLVGLSLVEQHRRVYEALSAPLADGTIHELRIKTKGAT